jgi:hypothetical protein
VVAGAAGVEVLASRSLTDSACWLGATLRDSELPTLKGVPGEWRPLHEMEVFIMALLRVWTGGMAIPGMPVLFILIAVSLVVGLGTALLTRSLPARSPDGSHD